MNTRVDGQALSVDQGEGAALPRDVAATALVLAIASVAWFGWSTADVDGAWAVVATIGMLAGLVVAGLALVRVVRTRGTGSVMADAAARRRYNVVVGLEVVLIFLGVSVLNRLDLIAQLAPWILLVVAVHFLPLARLFRVRALAVCGVVLIVVALAAAVVEAGGVLAGTALAGGAGGAVMLASALVCLRSNRG